MKKKEIIKVMIAVAFFSFFCVGGSLIHAENEGTIDNSVNQEVFSESDEFGNVTLYTANDVRSPDGEYDVIKVSGDKETIIATGESFEEANSISNHSKKARSSGKIFVQETVNNIKPYASNDYKVVKLLEKWENGNAYYTNVINAETGHKTSISWSTSRDAAYIRTEGDYYIAKIAGITAKISVSDAVLVDYSNSLVISHYSTTQGKLYHNITKNMTSLSAVLVGYTPGYLTNGNTYYSYDGHYFYDSYQKMIDDYKRNSNSNAINGGNPYFNYYQYLPHRSKTSYTASQINDYLNTKIDSNSKLYKMGNSFVSAQNTYGVNAILMLGVSINESNWGKSSLSLNKNNLFGHNATDGDPFANGSVYTTPGDSIKSHAIMYVTQYADPGDYRYFGNHLGDKQSGMNVYYATDAYWGEKAAQQAYYLDEYYKNSVDINKYKIGLTNSTVNVRSDKYLNSSVLYKTANKQRIIINNPIVILETLKGDTVSDSTDWYRIKSTSVLNNERTGLKYENDANKSASSDYKESRDYAFLHSSNVQVIFKGREMEGYKSGDITKDGEITSIDLLLAEKHITLSTSSTLTGVKFNRGDVNYDCLIDSRDLLSIEKNIVYGTYVN